ncbi:MAG: pentapeptide repeat-containing protein, partial [bacterium]
MHFLRQFRLSLPLGFCCLIVGLGLIIPELLWAYDQRDLGRLRNFGACVECNISEADLRMTKLNGANLRSSDMAKTIFFSANLQVADLSGSNLRGANLEQADLQGANLQGSN